MFLCDDVDLLPWEPGIFLETVLAHQAIVKDAAGTLTGTSLVMEAAALGNVEQGMVAQVVLAEGGLTQLLEVVAVTDARHATVSALRSRASHTAIPPLVGGAVKVSVLTFRPQIAAVGDALLAMVGVASDRLTEPTPASARLCGFRTATIFGTLSAVFRMMKDGEEASSITPAKRTFYDELARAARRSLSAIIDTDGDGVPETEVQAAVPALRRP